MRELEHPGVHLGADRGDLATIQAGDHDPAIELVVQHHAPPFVDVHGGDERCCNRYHVLLDDRALLDGVLGEAQVCHTVGQLLFRHIVGPVERDQTAVRYRVQSAGARQVDEGRGVLAVATSHDPRVVQVEGEHVLGPLGAGDLLWGRDAGRA